MRAMNQMLQDCQKPLADSLGVIQAVCFFTGSEEMAPFKFVIKVRRVKHKPANPCILISV